MYLKNNYYFRLFFLDPYNLWVACSMDSNYETEKLNRELKGYADVHICVIVIKMLKKVVSSVD